MTKIAGSGFGSGSISQRHGSADPDPDRDPPQKCHGSATLVSIFCCYQGQRAGPLCRKRLASHIRELDRQPRRHLSHPQAGFGSTPPPPPPFKGTVAKDFRKNANCPHLTLNGTLLIHWRLDTYGNANK
jgi:hypothetical protein